MRGCLISCLLLLSLKGTSQVSVKDSIIRFPLLSLSYAFQLPGGDLAQRFGPNSNLGFTSLFKNKKNYLFGLDGNFIFGSDIKETGILDSISTSEGIIIDNSGIPAEIRLFERGFSVSAGIGKIFPLKRLSPNKNSGFTLLFKAGYFQHKIRIEDINHSAPQLEGDYREGYDRLTNGYAIHEFIGYTYLSNRRLINFSFGFEFIQAFTKSRRYDFDLRQINTRLRKDYLNGVRIGWIIPLYKKVPNEYYYY